MMISTKGRYALRILVDLAENGGGGFVTLKAVAERQEISEKYLESIVKDLVRACFLLGLRGKGGGACPVPVRPDAGRSRSGGGWTGSWPTICRAIPCRI